MVVALPPLTSRAAGSRITAAIYQQDITDSINFLLNPVNFTGTQSVAQSLPNSAWTAITLDTSQTDPYAGHSNVTNSSRYTCPAGCAGWYTVCGVVAYSPNATGFRTARIQINGAGISGQTSYGPNNGGAETITVTGTRDIFLNAGDYVEVAGYQSSGGALNTAVSPSPASALWLRFSHGA
jgi:hypothetical protein